MNNSETISNEPIKIVKKNSGNPRGFIERTLVSLAEKLERAIFAEQLARTDGFLQKIDPRVKIVGILLMIISATLARNFFTIWLIFFAAILLAAISRVPIRVLAARAWLGALIFTGLIAFPVIFITPGEAIYNTPFVNLTITKQGLTSAIYLISRVETTVTLSLLLVLCTLWTHLLKALRILRVPVVFVVILGMTYRYLFVMLETAQNMFEARKSRLIGELSSSEKRRIASASIGVLLTKSLHLNNEIYLAMQSRGFRGEVYTLDDFEMKRRDWFFLFIFLIAAVLTIWLGRFDSLAALLDYL